MRVVKTAADVSAWIFQHLTFVLLIVLALASLTLTLMAAFGAAGWFQWTAQFGETPYPNAGMYAQIVVTLLLIGLCFFLPSHARMNRLETSHRLFQIGMNDVAKAYALAHAADRQGTFQLSGEFDAVRERLMFLRDHPDLSQLEPAVLEVAAQMSHVSAELARVYSDENVGRARHVLQERQHEIEQFNARIDDAKRVTNEIKTWLSQVELEESVARAQLDRLMDDLADVLPSLGLEVTSGQADNQADVVTLPHAAE